MKENERKRERKRMRERERKRKIRIAMDKNYKIKQFLRCPFSGSPKPGEGNLGSSKKTDTQSILEATRPIKTHTKRACITAKIFHV